MFKRKWNFFKKKKAMGDGVHDGLNLKTESSGMKITVSLIIAKIKAAIIENGVRFIKDDVPKKIVEAT